MPKNNKKILEPQNFETLILINLRCSGKVPPLIRKTKVVAKYHTCHAKRRWMSHDVAKYHAATQSVAASQAMKGVTFNLKLCVVTKLYVRVACEYVNDKVVCDNDECHKAVCEKWCDKVVCVCDKVVYALSASDVRDKAVCV